MSRDDPVTQLPQGLYEQIVNRLVERQLRGLDPDTFNVETDCLDPGESHAALAFYLELVIRRVLDGLQGDTRLEQQIDLCNAVIRSLNDASSGLNLDDSQIIKGAQRLLAVYEAQGSSLRIERPDTPLSLGCVLTGTRLDPSLASQLKKEIKSADRINILCSFIKWSGIRVLAEDLEEFVARPGAELRVITTSYMGATDMKAIDYLQALPNTQLRVSYDTHRTRLHAKAYLFHRASGFGQAYVGSANISSAALTEGLEWNVKISQYESPHLWRKVTATFETYWGDAEFCPYSADDHTHLSDAIKRERSGGSSDIPYLNFDLVPYSYQREILDQLEAEREVRGLSRHLVVAATGTGKTMVAAFDYRSWCRTCGKTGSERPSLLFIAHREEILKQSLYTFRAVLRDHNFGGLCAAGQYDDRERYLFATIQSYNSKELWRLPSTRFDYVVVDEFHHAAADSYRRLLNAVEPKVLLGLTATPERSDELDILGFFGGHISAEIRLPDAINRRLLCPFQYFGVTDSVDFSKLQWSRGGYAIDDLDRVLSGNDVRARLIVDKVNDKLLDPRQARGLGFCVSVAHAEYMARRFCEAGIPAEALTGDADRERRDSIQDKLRNREVNFIFTVDLYNEGVDIPEVDTVLFLRPTESLTVFLQQLGRGLRLSPEKDCLTVLDFIGQAHRNFRFDWRLRALGNVAPNSLEEQVRNGFPFLPAGCSIELERVAREHILANIGQYIRQSRQTLVREVRDFERNFGSRPTLSTFLERLNLEPDDIYRRGISWSRLCVEARIRPDFGDADEERLTKGLRRIQHLSSPEQISWTLEAIRNTGAALKRIRADELERRRLLMLLISIWGREPIVSTETEGLERLVSNTILCEELSELLECRLAQVRNVPARLDLPFSCPLSLHAQYTLDEVLVAIGHWTLSSRPQMREGVLHLADIRTDALFVTLNKTEQDYSPSTMYDDYAINDELFHWQSQSTTSDESPTGRRYIEHENRGHTILLFVREHRRSNNLSCPYFFLGPARHVSHEGSRPMSIIWRLSHRMPAQILRRTARLAAS